MSDTTAPISTSSASARRPPRSCLLSRRFYARPADALAVALLGQTLVRILPDGTRLAGRIVETEAYLGVEDRAAHSRDGRRTPRNESMYARPGTAYVYFTYGMHHCFNVVCAREGEPAAVLVRALEPLQGLDAMRRHRSRRRASPPAETELCSGPGRVGEAMAIARDLDGVDLAGGDGPLFIVRSRTRPLADNALLNTPRIGVGYAGEWADRPLRWFIAGNPHVSARGKGAVPGRSRRRPLR